LVSISLFLILDNNYGIGSLIIGGVSSNNILRDVCSNKNVFGFEGIKGLYPTNGDIQAKSIVEEFSLSIFSSKHRDFLLYRYLDSFWLSS
jgi:hypothetical protein